MTMMPSASTTITPSAMCSSTVADKRNFSSASLRAVISAYTQMLPSLGRSGSSAQPLTSAQNRLPSRRLYWRSSLKSPPAARAGYWRSPASSKSYELVNTMAVELPVISAWP
ncbi:hypothetical protein D3C72_1460280 [compost metagenome]